MSGMSGYLVMMHWFKIQVAHFKGTILSSISDLKSQNPKRVAEDGTLNSISLTNMFSNINSNIFSRRSWEGYDLRVERGLNVLTGVFLFWS